LNERIKIDMYIVENWNVVLRRYIVRVARIARQVAHVSGAGIDDIVTFWFNDGNLSPKTYRPSEREGQSDGIFESVLRSVRAGVRLELRGDDVSEGARGGGVDFDLVLLEANPEARSTHPLAFRVRSGDAAAAFSQIVLPGFVVERYQS
jgi:hypothetical protein